MFRIVLSTLLVILLAGSSQAQPSSQPVAIAALDVGVAVHSSDAATEDVAARSATMRRVASETPMDLRLSPAQMLTFSSAARDAGNDRVVRSADLLSFQGSFIKGLVRLNWTVKPEARVLGFAVERRSQSDEHWTTVRYVRTSAKSNAQGYSHYDENGVDGVTYYRLRQVGNDGLSVPSPAISVMPHLVPNSFVIWQHKVDPFTRFGTLSFGLGSDMPVTVSIVDSYGRVVSSLIETRTLESGHHIIPFSTQALPSGVYTLRMQTCNGVQSRRLAIM